MTRGSIVALFAFKLLLEGEQFREGRIGIGLFLAFAARRLARCELALAAAARTLVLVIAARRTRPAGALAETGLFVPTLILVAIIATGRAISLWAISLWPFTLGTSASGAITARAIIWRPILPVLCGR